MGKRFMVVILIISLIVLFIDIYSFKGIKVLARSLNGNYSQIIFYAFWTISIIMIVGLFIIYFNRTSFPGPKGYEIFGFVVGFFVLFYVPKLVFISFHAIDDILTILSKGVGLIFKDLGSLDRILNSIKNSIVITQIGIVISMIPFISIVYGIAWGKYNYKTIDVSLTLKNLPKQFEGLRIVQFSDFHIGSFAGNKKQIERAVKKINEEEPDLLLFTGDMVNDLANEMDEFIPILEKLKANIGKYAVLGNHDYADYVNWEKEEGKQSNMISLKNNMEKIGFDLLLNESVRIERDSNEIAVIGVENWGLPPFPQHGNLKKALQNVQDVPVKILLSHDPSHWDEEVIEKTNIDLTLSGHTHGMQFGINFLGFKWSPVKWRYPRWGGLYQKGDQYLYVNIGIGYIAFPGRVGMPPEITVFTLTGNR